MVRCPKCKDDDYEIIYIEDYTYEGNDVIVFAKARCCKFNNQFFVREFFDFISGENV